MPFFAVAMTVLIGFAGLATDSGLVWITQAQLQHSVDAAALAAAQDLPESDVAEPVACDFATVRNAVPEMTGATGTTCAGLADVSFLEQDTAVRVTAYRTVQPIFGQVLNFDSIEVSAQATARIGSLGSTCLFPLFVTTDQLTAGTEFYVPIAFAPANTAVDVGSGSQAVREAMEELECEGGSPTSFDGAIGQDVPVKPGSATQFKGGWEAIAEQATSAESACPSTDIVTYTIVDAGGDTKLDPSLTTENCPRLILIPILPPGDYGGNSSGVIQGFIPFYFAEYCDTSGGCPMPNGGTVERHKAWGYYVRMDVTSLTFFDYQPDYGTKVVALAD
jgi:hypothetical protein